MEVINHHWRETVYQIFKNGDNNKNVIILCHWFLWHKWSSLNVAVTKKISNDKIDVITFDFYGHWDSNSDIWELTINKCIEDLNSIVQFAKLKYKNIGIIANSLWGLVTLCDKDIDKDIKFLILRAPISDWYEKEITSLGQQKINLWKEEWYIIRKYWERIIKLSSILLTSIQENNAYKEASRIKYPVLIIHWTKDKNVDFHQSVLLHEKIKNSEIRLIEGWEHAWEANNKGDEVLNIICDFIRKYF